MNEKEYLEERLENQISWYSKKSKSNQDYFKRFRIVEIICASLIPFLSGVSASIDYSEWIIGGLGVLIAISAAISSLYKFQENWIEYRTTTESLKHERYLYLTESKPYTGENRFNVLVSRVEALISKENSNWSQLTSEEDKSSKPQPDPHG